MRPVRTILTAIMMLLLTKGLGVAALTGDINGDGIVNSLDWSIMNSQWFTSGPEADLNGDGIVNSIDFSIMNQNWGKVEDEVDRIVFQWPVDNPLVTQVYACRLCITGTARYNSGINIHTGVDVRPVGSGSFDYTKPVKVTADGWVEKIISWPNRPL